MIDFLGSAPGSWFTYVLILCFATAWYANGVRTLFSWQAWAVLALFYVGVFASNAWQIVPRPEGAAALDPEAQRIWWLRSNEAVHQSKMLVRDLAIGAALVLAFGFYNRAPTLTRLILFVWFSAEFGESLERFVCKRNDPAFGFEHIYLATGETRPTCGRAFGDWANLVFPIITVLPLPIVLCVTAWKRHKSRLRAF